MLPCGKFVQAYNPAERPWFAQAVLHAPHVALTVPYKDSSTNGLIVTFSLAVHDASGNLFGAVGLDLFLGNVRHWIFNPSVQCPPLTKCFLLSRSGHLLLDPSDDGHLLSGEPIFFGTRDADLAAVANDLITQGYLQKSYCLDFNSIKQQSYYTLNISALVSGITECDESVRSYVIAPVPGTSFYLAAVSSGTVSSVNPNCCVTHCPLPSSSLVLLSCERPCQVDLVLPNPCVGFQTSDAASTVAPCPGRATQLEPNTGTGLSTGELSAIIFGCVICGLIILSCAVVGCVSACSGKKGGVASKRDDQTGIEL